MHIGLAADYCEIIWNERYRVSSDTATDVCDYPLAPRSRTACHRDCLGDHHGIRIGRRPQGLIGDVA